MIFEAFRKFRRETPDAPAFLVSSGDRYVPITWRQFTDDVAAIAWAIGRHVPGSKIGIVGENSYQWISMHAACLLSGACAVPIDVNLTADEICERLGFVGAKGLAYSSLYGEKVSAVARQMPDVLCVGFGSYDADGLMEDGYSGGAAALWDGDGPARTEADGSPKVATIVFTSGTTSSPRGAELTLRGMRAFADFASGQLPMGPGDHSLMLLPIEAIALSEPGIESPLYP